MNRKGLTTNEWKIVQKTIYKEMLEDEKNWIPPSGSIIPNFEKDIRKLGFIFEISNQVEKICTDNPEITRPIILKYYKNALYDNEKSYLMACLISNKNKELISFFIDEFYKNKYSLLRNMIGNCLRETADDKYINEYLKMLEDDSLGDDRAIITWPIEKIKPKRAIPILIQFLNYDMLRWSALNTLNKYKNPELLSYFEKYKNDKNSNIRNIAKKGIKTIEKLLKK